MVALIFLQAILYPHWQDGKISSVKKLGSCNKAYEKKALMIY